MATVDEEIARLKFLSGKGRGAEKCHVVLIEEEARKRKENSGPQPKTRFVFETDDASMYSRFNEQKDRWLKLIPNKSVAVDMMCRIWEQCSDEAITEFGKDDDDEYSSAEDLSSA